MVNDYGIDLVEAFLNRFSLFFTFSSENKLYKGLKIISTMIFIIPFVVTTVLELVVLNVFKYVGLFISKVLGSNSFTVIPALIIGFVWGVVYLILTYIFMGIFWLCNLPELLSRLLGF